MQLAGGPGQPQRGGQEADSPAGHGVGFRYTVDDGHAVAQLGEGGDAGVTANVVDVLVDLVGDDDYLRVARQDVGQSLQLVVAVDAARGVRRRAEDERLRLGRDGGLELLGRDLEVLINAGGQDHVRALGQLDHLHVAHPVGGGHDDFVARIDEAEQGVADGLLGAVRDDDLVDGEVESVLVFEFGDDGFPQIQVARDGGVERVVVVDGLLRGGLDGVGGEEIGLADAQVDDVDALCLQLIAFLRHGQCSRRRETRQANRKMFHC